MYTLIKHKMYKLLLRQTYNTLFLIKLSKTIQNTVLVK